MKFQAEGLFYQYDPAARKPNRRAVRPAPPVPETGWRAPTEFPNLSAAKTLAIDTETYDPNLKVHGPGWARGDGHMVGFSIAVPDGTAWYFPIRHETQPEHNLDPASTLRWAQHVLGTDIPKVGANLIYDVGWFREEGVRVRGKLYDVQYAEALLNSEAPQVSLEALSKQYLGLGKQTDLLFKWLAEWFGGSPDNPELRKYLHKAPPQLVGPYGEADAALPMQILQAQWQKLIARGVLHLFEMECGLIPLLLDMRFKGAAIDVDYAHRLNDELQLDIDAVQRRVNAFVGFDVNVNSNAEMARAFDHLGLPYGRTAAGNPSFTKETLKPIKHGFTSTVLELRELQKTQGTFVQSYLLDGHVNGKIYGQFHLLRSDGSGTRSGRFASSNPNLQNIPTRTDVGKRVRKAFVATHKQIRSYDYSQIEYRLLVHHAVGQGAEEAREMFRNDPTTDYHDFTIDLLKRVAGVEMDRKPAKNINFGLIYGMGKDKLFRSIGDGAEAIYGAYHEAIPYAKATMDAASHEAEQHGYVVTLLGRKSDFTLWEPADWDDSRQGLPLERAVQVYGSNIRLAKTHKALNRKLQGGAADMMKMAMWKLYHWGYFDEVGVPILTVHDELDFDDEGAPESTWREVQHIMETAIDISIPVRVDLEVGPNWGDVK